MGECLKGGTKHVLGSYSLDELSVVIPRRVLWNRLRNSFCNHHFEASKHLHNTSPQYVLFHNASRSPPIRPVRWTVFMIISSVSRIALCTVQQTGWVWATYHLMSSIVLNFCLRGRCMVFYRPASFGGRYWSNCSWWCPKLWKEVPSRCVPPTHFPGHVTVLSDTNIRK